MPIVNISPVKMAVIIPENVPKNSNGSPSVSRTSQNTLVLRNAFLDITLRNIK